MEEGYPQAEVGQMARAVEQSDSMHIGSILPLQRVSTMVSTDIQGISIAWSFSSTRAHQFTAAAQHFGPKPSSTPKTSTAALKGKRRKTLAGPNSAIPTEVPTDSDRIRVDGGSTDGRGLFGCDSTALPTAAEIDPPLPGGIRLRSCVRDGQGGHRKWKVGNTRIGVPRCWKFEHGWECQPCKSLTIAWLISPAAVCEFVHQEVP